METDKRHCADRRVQIASAAANQNPPSDQVRGQGFAGKALPPQLHRRDDRVAPFFQPCDHCLSQMAAFLHRPICVRPGAPAFRVREVDIRALNRCGNRVHRRLMRHISFSRSPVSNTTCADYPDRSSRMTLSYAERVKQKAPLSAQPLQSISGGAVRALGVVRRFAHANRSVRFCSDTCATRSEPEQRRASSATSPPVR